MNIDVIFPNGLTIDDALLLLQPAAVYVLGMALYAIFVFKFYRFIAARDMFALDLSRYQDSRFRWMRGFLHVVLYVAKYVILFPAFAFFWFAVLTLILTFLSKDRMFSEILLIALATVSAIRVARTTTKTVTGPSQDPALRGPGDLPDRWVFLSV